MQGMEGPSLQVLFFSRSGTINIPVSYSTLMIEPHLLGGTVTVLDLRPCSSSLHVVSDSGLAPGTDPTHSGPQSSLCSPLISVYRFSVTGLLCSWLQQGEIPRLLLGSKPPTPSHSSESLVLEFWPVWCFISPLSLTLTRLFLTVS